MIFDIFRGGGDFKTLIDGNPSIKQVELSDYGEMFPNPELLELMKYAHEHNVLLAANNGVNLNTIKEEVIEGLVKFGLRGLTCSIDGASQDTYAKYRVGGDFDRVIENVRKINHHKKAYGTQYPKLTWQFVVFGHNQHEIPMARTLARELGMKLVLNSRGTTDSHLSGTELH